MLTFYLLFKVCPFLSDVQSHLDTNKHLYTCGLFLDPLLHSVDLFIWICAGNTLYKLVLLSDKFSFPVE